MCLPSSSPDCCSTKRQRPYFALPALRIQTENGVIDLRVKKQRIKHLEALSLPETSGKGRYSRTLKFHLLLLSRSSKITQEKYVNVSKYKFLDCDYENIYVLCKWQRLTCPSGETARYRTRNVCPVRVANCVREKLQISVL